MQKPLALSIAVCLGLAGCQVVQKSETWETVMGVHPGETIRDADPSSAYAEKLHRVLLDQGVEHIVVTYQYHYYTHEYNEAVGTRTAVVYRDDATGSYPWWLKDDRLAAPFWLPNGELDGQLSFYARRKVEVIEKKAYPGHGRSGKTSVALVHPAPASHRAVAVEKPQPVTHIAQSKPVPPPPARPVAKVQPAIEPAPASSAPMAKPVAVTKIQHPAAVAVARTKPSEEPAAAPHLNAFWSAPAVLDPVAQATDPAPRDEHLEKLFRQHNGTSFDPSSAMDRRKMEQLRHAALSRETTGEHGFRQGVDETVFR